MPVAYASLRSSEVFFAGFRIKFFRFAVRCGKIFL